MRHVVYFFLSLLIWGLVDDFVVNGPQPAPRAAASDDDEYLTGGAVRAPRRLAEAERIQPHAAVLPGDADSKFAGASLHYSGPDLQALDSDSRLYVFMSLQI